MDLMDKRQVFPYMISLLFIALIVSASYAVVSLSGATQAQTNLHYWHMERAAGFIAYELLALSVLLGVSSTATFWDRIRARRVVTLLHQFSALLMVPFVFLHLLGIHQDTSVPFTWQQLFVPGTATYRAAATAFGSIGLYTLGIVILSSFLRHRNGIRIWRAIHYITFPLFLLLTIHGFWSGTDSQASWAQLLYLVPSILFVVFVFKRVTTR